MKKRWIMMGFLALLILAAGILMWMEPSGKRDRQETEETADRVDTEEYDSVNTDRDTSAEEDGEKQDLPQSGQVGALAVKDGKLTDQNGDPVVLRGISTHGINWYPQYVNEETFRYLQETYGINVIRLAMYTAEYNGYCTGDDANRQTLKDTVAKGVECATDLGMYVIIDWHTLSDSNPLQNKEMAKDFFTEMSERYGDYDNVIYEICNEPNGTSWQDIKAYAEEMIPVIRENDADAVILVGTPNWCQYLGEAAEDPLTGENIMYTLHFYAGTHKEDLRNTAREAIDSKLPIFVSEFGICEASGNGNLDLESANAWMELLEENQISYVMWNLSNKDEASAFLKPGCEKLSGFTDEDLSDSAKWYVQ